MLAKVTSCALVGLEGTLVDVEVDVESRGLPSLAIVGLPDEAINESRERIRSAIINSDLAYPRHSTTVNLASADLRKEGPASDLPIALVLLIASAQISPDVDDAPSAGELSPDSTVRRAHDILLVASCARTCGLPPVYVPPVGVSEAASAQGVDVIPVDSLLSLLIHLRRIISVAPHRVDVASAQFPHSIEPATRTGWLKDVTHEHSDRSPRGRARGLHYPKSLSAKLGR